MEDMLNTIADRMVFEHGYTGWGNEPDWYATLSDEISAYLTKHKFSDKVKKAVEELVGGEV